MKPLATLFLAVCLTPAPAAAQTGTVHAICSTDQSWCELAAQEFTRATGVKVLQTRKATGEALAQLRAEAANPKTDLWWGGTGDPYYQAAEVGLLDAYRPEYLGDLHGWAVRQYAMSRTMWAVSTPAPSALAGARGRATRSAGSPWSRVRATAKQRGDTTTG